MSLSWILGTAQLKFHHSGKTIEYKTKLGEKRSLADICKESTPPCHLSPLLFNGHLQTIYTAIPDNTVPIWYKRELFESDNPDVEGSFAVDFAVDAYPGEDQELPPRTTFFQDAELESIGSVDSSPMLIVLHGLSGGSFEPYVRHVISLLVNNTTPTPDTKNWKACVLNARGCANSKVTSSVLFNARATWDVRQLVKWLRKTFPNRPLFAVGFSLGANILVNYLAEEGPDCQIKGAVTISNPWNLDVGSVALQRTFLGLQVYSRAMGGNLRRLFAKHEDVICKNPAIDVKKVKSVTYLHEFDREVQCASWGYPSEGAYYRDASSIDSLLNVRVPLLAINAEDDPIVPVECLPLIAVKQNPFVVLCTTSHGGHIGWFEPWQGRWFAKPTAQFLDSLARGPELSIPPSAMDLLPWPSENAASSRWKYRPMRRKMQVEQEEPGAS